LNTPARVRTRPLAAPTRKTAATLRRKATLAFDMRMSGPTARSSWKGAKPSVSGRSRRLIAAQT
jgi:hypothetical protein